MRPGFHEWMLRVCETVALRSPDPSSQFGCVIVRPDKSIAATGYNGFPRMMYDKPEWWEDRTEKYDRVIHSEMNALLHARENLSGYTLYVSGFPCKDCAKHIAAAGIRQVVVRQPSPDYLARWCIDRPKQIFIDSGVEILMIGNDSSCSVMRIA